MKTYKSQVIKVALSEESLAKLDEEVARAIEAVGSRRAMGDQNPYVRRTPTRTSVMREIVEEWLWLAESKREAARLERLRRERERLDAEIEEAERLAVPHIGKLDMIR